MKKLPTNYFLNIDDLGIPYSVASAEEKKLAFARIEEKVRTVKTKPKAAQWDDYWREMAEAQAASPSFFKKTESGPSIFRHDGGFIVTDKKDLAVDALHHIIGNIVRRLPKTVTGAVEFGCGNGHNLEYLRTIFPFYTLTGCDISKWAVKTVRDKGCRGLEFDMTDPAPSKALPNGEDVVYFTSGSMKQTGKKWKKFYAFLRQSRVKYIFHIEPIEEFYGERSRVERLALQFHRAKGYLSGYLTFLGGQKDFSVEYSKCDFGTLFDQGFNVVLLTRK